VRFLPVFFCGSETSDEKHSRPEISLHFRGYCPSVFDQALLRQGYGGQADRAGSALPFWMACAASESSTDKKHTQKMGIGRVRIHFPASVSTRMSSGMWRKPVFHKVLKPGVLCGDQ
jgi:hypothetical protein